MNRVSRVDASKRLVFLEALLADANIEYLIEFDAAYDRQMQLAFTWRLWGAAYLINGGASTDGFEYFRSWLISMGRNVFTAAVLDPDSLADVISGQNVAFELEGLAYIARSLAEAKGWGSNFDALVNDSDGVAPVGVPFPENDKKFYSEQYPRLFGKLDA